MTEAAQRPTMHFVAVRTEAQQAQGMLFRTRDLLARQRTETINALRGHLAEYGVVAPKGRARIGQLPAVLEDGDCGLPETVAELGWLLLGRIDELDEKIDGPDRELQASARQNDETARLMTIPGVGPVAAMAMGSFRRGRNFLGLARPRAAAAHHRRQAEAGQDIEDGPGRPETVPGQGSHGGSFSTRADAARSRIRGWPECWRASQ